MLDISPFACQKTPALPVSAVAVAALLLVTAGLVTAGLAAFRRRDLAPE